MGESPASDTLLNLVICDPAMGSGAFLVAACRYLADHVVAAWTREDRLEIIADAHDDVVNHARRLVAQRCLYGVDKNKYAVQLARLSLWLVTMAREEPFTFVDHALRHGDSLVGLNFDQLRAFHWKPEKQVETSANLLKEALNEAIGIRQKILELASEGTWYAQREKERLLLDAEDALDRVRLIGDLVIGAFFSKSKNKDREDERNRRLDLVEQWLGFDRRGDGAKADEVLAELRTLQTELKRTQVPFHWMVEFPEVFYAERPDPLDGGRRNGAAWIDGFVGNPPFMDGNAVSGNLGNEYRDWLKGIFEGSSSKADICALFFRQCHHLVGCNGIIALVATKTIAEGPTRATGLDWITARGATLVYARSRFPWPGEAAVVAAVVAAAVGRVVSSMVPILDGQLVVSIGSDLVAASKKSTSTGVVDPEPILRNRNLCSQGVDVYGTGFFLSPTEAEAISRDCTPIEAARIRPFLGGEEANEAVNAKPPRFAVYLDDLDFQQASAEAPQLLKFISERVRPQRLALRDTPDGARLKQSWWQYNRGRSEFFANLKRIKHCLVASRHAKHWCVSVWPSDWLFSDGACVFALDCFTAFAVLQSRPHVWWAWKTGSTLKDDLRYKPPRSFGTFPFPDSDPRKVISELERVGQQVHAFRSTYIVETDQGLTKTYNALKDPDNDDSRIFELRRFHEEMDRAVLDAYGWSDIEVPPYCPKTDAERAAVKAFEDDVMDRLFVLKAERAAQERAASNEQSKVATPNKPKKAAAPDEKSAKKKSVKVAPEGQGSLF